MIVQFLKQAPGELESMKEAFNENNYPELAHLAHNFKTSISFMGLTNTLNYYLDYIENNASIQNANEEIEAKIMTIDSICQRAFREAKNYLVGN
jgi:HPt (histidine-containing phosphotransfer) domain-containing protein